MSVPHTAKTRIAPIIYCALILVALLHLLSAFPSLYASYQAYRHAQNVYLLNDITDELYEVVDNLGFERGRVNVVLNDAGPVEGMEKNRLFIVARSTDADAGLSRAIDKLGRLGFAKTSQQTAETLTLKSDIDLLRKQVMSAMLVPKAERDARLSARWFNAMTSYIEKIESILLLISSDISDADGLIARYSSLKYATLSLRNSAGPEISILSGVMLSQVPMTSAQLEHIKQLQGVTKAHFKSLEMLSRPLTETSIPEALARMKRFYVSQYLPYRDQTLAAATAGSPFPYSQSAFLKQGVSTLEQISAFNKVLVAATKQYAERNLAAHKHTIVMQLFSSISSFIIILLIFFFIHYRLISPLSQVTRAIRSLAAKDLAIDIPAIKADNEIGELAQAVHVFRNMAVQIEEDMLTTKSLQAELIAARNAADAANQSKSEFLANMSHEIRTPMNGVVGMLQLLNFTELSNEQHEYIQSIEASAENLLAIINDILDLSKIESGKVELEEAPFSLQQCVHDVELMQRSRAYEKKLRIEVNWGPDLPHTVCGDQLRLKQVLLNLLSNAIKFTEQGMVDINVSLLEHTDEQVVVRLSVQDTGIGMTPDVLQKIFEPFTQADTSTTRRFGGTGLGLSICRRLAELMGGRIWVESEAWSGSTFHLELPFRHPATIFLKPDDEPQMLLVAENALTVLVADDNPLNLKTAVMLLKKMGHHVRFATNGLQAVEQWRAGGIDAMLMDINMPEMGGVEALQLIRSEEHTAGTPRVWMVALTADALRGAEERYLTAGFDAYISKPFKLQQLQEAFASMKSQSSQG